jgi:hypothetical protein
MMWRKAAGFWRGRHPRGAKSRPPAVHPYPSLILWTLLPVASVLYATPLAGERFSAGERLPLIPVGSIIGE